MAVSSDITRGVLGVTGCNYALLLSRSVDFSGETLCKAFDLAGSPAVHGAGQRVAKRKLVGGGVLLMA
jgi:hypothetical protein